MSPDSKRPADSPNDDSVTGPDTNQDAVGKLIRMGGRRPAADDERVRRSRAKVEAHWQRSVRARSRRRTYGWVAIAAAASLAGVLWLLQGAWAPGPSTRAIAAQVSRVEGAVEVIRPGSVDPVEVAAADPLVVGSRIVTPTGTRIAVSLQETGHSVRIDQNATLEIVGPETLVLEQGTIYVDSGRIRERMIPVRVQTPYGVVQDIGTQFEVFVQPDGGRDAIRVRVREGAVVVRTARGTERIDVGREGRFAADGDFTSSAMEPDGQEWAWVRGFTVPFPIEGLSAESFLQWAAREGGWKLRLHPDAAATARGAILAGDIEGLTIEQALAGVLPTCGLQHRLEEGELVITLAGG